MAQGPSARRSGWRGPQGRAKPARADGVVRASLPLAALPPERGAGEKPTPRKERTMSEHFSPRIPWLGDGGRWGIP